jgi:hypothetical protein
MIVASLEAFRRQWEREIEERRLASRRNQPDGTDRHFAGAANLAQLRSVAVESSDDSDVVEEEKEEQVLSRLPLGVETLPKFVQEDGGGFQVEASEETRWCPASVPAEIWLQVLAQLDAAALCAASLVCKALLPLARQRALWRRLCWQRWRGDSDLESELVAAHASSWFRMRCRRPYLRMDGVYCAKVSYVRRGVAEWTFNTPVHTVIYYRYLRFFPDGSLLSATSFDQPFRPSDHDKDEEEDEYDKPPPRHPKSADVSWLMKPERVGTRLPRATVLQGVFSAHRFFFPFFCCSSQYLFVLFVPPLLLFCFSSFPVVLFLLRFVASSTCRRFR